MPKYKVSKEMGTALRNLRLRQEKKATDVASAIGKTGAFMSKLENGALNTIQEKDLINIIRELSDDEKSFNKNIELLLTDSSVEYSKKESEKEEWRLNLELFYQKFAVPDEYLKFVKKEMSTLNISWKELAAYINSNADLYNNDDFTKEQLDKAEKNHWYFNNGKSFIVVYIKPERIENFLNSNKKIYANYSMLLCILVSLFRLKKNSPEDAYKKAYQILAKLKIYTISEKESIMQSYDKVDKMHTILDQRENENLPESDRKLYSSLYTFVRRTNMFAQTHSIDYVNSRMDTMIKNLTTDPIMFMGYIGINLEKMKDCDVSTKREFVNAIKDLVDEYSIRKPKSDEELI